MPLQQKDNFETLSTWLHETLSEQNSLTPHINGIPKIKSKGIYFWFMHRDGYKQLSSFVEIAPIVPVVKKTINEIEYNLVYLGTAGTGKEGNSNLEERFTWHIDQNHSNSNVCHGTLSTLRAGLGALLADDLILRNTENIVNEFMAKFMKLYWIEYTEDKAFIDNDEKILIVGIRPLLNLKNNPNAKGNAFANSTQTYNQRRFRIYISTRQRLGCLGTSQANMEKVNNVNAPIIQVFNYGHQIIEGCITKQKKERMQRINEYLFELNNEKYHLTWFDKPRLTKRGTEQKLLPNLTAYITEKKLPIKLINRNGNKEVPYTLARKILEYFSDKLSNEKRIGSSINLKAPEAVKAEVSSDTTRMPHHNNLKREKISDNLNVEKKKEMLSSKLDWSKIKDKSKPKLLIIGCSDSKISGGNLIMENDYFNVNNYEDLTQKRQDRSLAYCNLLLNDKNYFDKKRLGVKVNVDYFQDQLNELNYLDAIDRYAGFFYNENLKNLYRAKNNESNLHILIISGLYGVIEFRDSVIDYHLELKKRPFWQNRDNWTINHAVKKYIAENQISNEMVFYSMSKKGYTLALKPISEWTSIWISHDRGQTSASFLENHFLTEL